MTTVCPHESYITEWETDNKDKQMKNITLGEYRNYEETVQVKETKRHYFRYGIKFEHKLKRGEQGNHINISQG